MSQRFDWKAEDEDSWGQFEPDDGNRRRQRPIRQHWTLALLVLLIFISGALLAFRQIQQLVADASMSVEEEVLSGHEFVLEASNQADPELLTTVLSGRDPAWTKSQIQLVDLGLLVDRQQIGLKWLPDQPAQIEVIISPDLAEAQVVSQYQYQPADPNNSQAAVTLEHTAIYRRSDDRWLLSPPLFDFWGETVVVGGRYLELSFPKRDEEIGRRLAADLEAAIGEACNSLALNCRPDLRLFVRLTSEPSTLVDLANAHDHVEGSQDLSLPAPTLFGKPKDEAGYRAFFHIYAQRVVAGFIGEAVGWRCCQHVLFYQALLDMQLAELGLGYWPLTSEHYRQALDGMSGIDQGLWTSEGPLSELLARPDWWLAYALVEYIVDDWARVPIPEMQGLLPRTPFFADWFGQVTRQDANDSFADGWPQFLMRKAESISASPGTGSIDM